MVRRFTDAIWVDSSVVEQGGVESLVVIDEEYKEAALEAVARSTAAAKSPG